MTTSPLQQIIDLAKHLDTLELRSLASVLMHTAYARENKKEKEIKNMFD